MKTLILMIIIMFHYSLGYAIPNIEYSNKSVQKSFDETWNNAINWVADNKCSIILIDKNSGLVNVEFNLFVVKNDKYTGYIYEDSVLPLSNCNVNIYILLKPKAEQTEVQIITHFNSIKYTKSLGGKAAVTKSEKLNINSSGKLEKEIYDFLNK